MSDEKRFAATPSRLARAKREGDGARSQDLGAVVSFAAAIVALFAALAPLAAAARMALAAAARPDSFSPWPYVAMCLGVGAVLVAALGGSLTATYLQTQTFVVRFPQPNFAKLDPFKGLARLCGRDAALGAAKALVVSSVVGVSLVPAVRGGFAPALGTSPAALGSLAVRALQSAFASAVGVALLFACADAFLERMKWKRRLRMSFEELRRDHKASDGDPLLRGRRRQQHRALIRGSVARVRDAAFVVTNPTHVAIALEYAPPDVAVPRVLVRAVDDGAREVKRLAREFGVPLVENVALARALLATTDVGDFIPPDAYGAVAAIVAMLLRTQAIAS